MKWLKLDLTLVLFFSLCFFLGLYSLTLSFSGKDRQEEILGEIDRRGVSEKKFIEAKYFVQNDGHSVLQMKSELITINAQEGVTSFTFPEGEVYTQKGTPITFQAVESNYYRSEHLLELLGHVNLDDPYSHFASEKARYFWQEKHLEAQGTIDSWVVHPQSRDRVHIKSDAVEVWSEKGIAQYKGKVQGRIERARPYEKGILFSSDELVFNREQGLITLTGNVTLKKQGVTAQSLRAEIYLDNYNKKLKYYVLYDDVRITENVKLPSGRIVTRRAFSEKLEGFMREKKIVLSGFPKVIQEKEYVKGNIITLRENSDIIEVVDANSRVLIDREGSQE